MNCKPEEMAVVIRADFTKQLIGRFVWIVRRSVPGEMVGGFVCPGGEPAWICTPLTDELLPWTSVDGTVDWVRERSIADFILRPIRPGESPEESIEAMRLLTNIPSEVTT